MALRLSLQNLAYGDPVILQLALFSSHALAETVAAASLG